MYKIECNYQVTVDKNNDFVAHISPGCDVCAKTVNAFGGKFSTADEVETLIKNKHTVHHHPLTGPIYIDGAEKGDVLVVHIKDIKVFEAAQSLSVSAGIDPIESAGDRAITLPTHNGKVIDYNESVKLNIAPSVGIVATTSDAGAIKTGHAVKRNGGNLDIPFVCPGADIYLPVDIDGAGLYLGDVHALLAYGELGGIAMEASSEVIFGVDIIKHTRLNNIVIHGTEPFSGQESIGFVGIGGIGDIASAVRDAFRGCCECIKAAVVDTDINSIKKLVTLIGHTLLGQAYSKTSESTAVIVIKKSDWDKLKGTVTE